MDEINWSNDSFSDMFSLDFDSLFSIVDLESLEMKEYNKYYTSDSLWKIWLVESIQSIHNSLWTWHNKCNICCRYYNYHVKFIICLVAKPLGVFSSETKWLNPSDELCKKCVIKQLLNSVFTSYHKLSNPRVCVITQTSALIIHDIMLIQ